jgi:hypothetical protein
MWKKVKILLIFLKKKFILKKIHQALESRINSNFTRIEVRTLLRKLEEDGEFYVVFKFKSDMSKMYSEALN